MQPSQGTAWSRPISRPCSTSVPLLQWPPLGSVLGSLAAPPPRLLCSEKGCWTEVRPPVQSREREENQGWWRLGGPRYLGEEEEKDPAWWRRRGGSSGDARVAGALAVPGRQSPQRKGWRTVRLCLGGAASANGSTALAEPPWSPPSCRLEGTAAPGLAARSIATSGAALEEEAPVRLHPTPCLLEGARIAWFRASGWGSDVLFPNPVAAPSRRRHVIHRMFFQPVSQSRPIVSRCRVTV